MLRGPIKVLKGPQLGRGPQFSDHWPKTSITVSAKETINWERKECLHEHVALQQIPFEFQRESINKPDSIEFTGFTFCLHKRSGFEMKTKDAAMMKATESQRLSALITLR